MLRQFSLCMAFPFAILWFALSTVARSESSDVVVYGATPAGIASSISAASNGQSVMLVEPTPRIGGLVTSGLSHTDFHSFESLSGSFYQFAKRVENDYIKNYGADSEQVEASFRGTFGEPYVNLKIFHEMLSEYPSIRLRPQYSLRSVEIVAGKNHREIRSALFFTASGEELVVQASIFIDATYEGDLMAKAGVAWRSGREGRDEFGESLAPETSDQQLQAYNFRFMMTQDPNNRVLPDAPPGYRREDFAEVVSVLESGKIERIFGYPRKCIFKAQTPAIPNGKYDINDVSQEVVRLSLPGKNLEWPNGDSLARQRIFNEHLRDQVGLLYFLQNDHAVPTRFRDEARQWGWCRDEFEQTHHLPPQLYVREARRMQGLYVYSQKDSEHAPNDARATLHCDAIAMGDYGNNCHGTSHEGSRFGGKHAGEFYNPVPPYQIPYGVLVAREVGNLLVPGAVSSTHVGFCALRLEPIWMSLGQAAGHAASQAIQQKKGVAEIDVGRLQTRLHVDRSATIYVTDITPLSEEFAMVQWWGTAGGLHGLAPIPVRLGQRGEKLHGQYSKAVPDHQVELHRPLDDKLRKRWIELANQIAPVSAIRSTLESAATRGDFIQAVWRLHVDSSSH